MDSDGEWFPWTGRVRMDQGRIAQRGLLGPGQKRCARLEVLYYPELLFLGTAIVLLFCTDLNASPHGDAGFERFRTIAEKNIFARPPAAGEEAEASPEQPPSVASAEIKLIGIVRMRDPRSSIAIIEAGGRHRLCRVGDHIGTMVLRSIRDQEIVFETPEGPWVAQIELDALRLAPSPARRADPASACRVKSKPVPASCRQLPIRMIDVQQLAQAGLVPYTQDGNVKGLELTRDIIGLRKGDRVTHVDGQALSAKRPRQKLWQIVKKHSVGRIPVPGIHVIVEREHRMVEFFVSLVG